MKKMVTVRELKEYCGKNKPQRILFLTENQDWYRLSDSYRLEMSFSTMLVCENPNLIFLKSGTNSIVFTRVRKVEIDTEIAVIGTVFRIFCGTYGAEEYDIVHTLVAS